MPSRPTIRSVKRKTPSAAAIPARPADVLKMSFDFPFDLPARTPHVDGQSQDGYGSDEREGALEPLLVCRVEEKVAADATDGDRYGDTPMHRLGQFETATLTQVREADRDKKEGFESFSQSDDERLQHGAWNAFSRK